MSGSHHNSAVIGDFPDVSIPMTDPETGRVSLPWYFLLQRLFKRTGDSLGGSITEAQAGATAALALAGTAQAAAGVAQASAGAAQTSASAANVAVVNESIRAQQAEALLAPLVGATFTGLVVAPEFRITGLTTWTSGVGIPSSTQPVGSMYSRTGGAIGSTLYVSRGGGVWNAVAGV
jgi:hypothetical protein